MSSELGHRTTLKLYLPRYTGRAEQPRSLQTRDLDSLRGRPQETILVVEDDEQVRSLTVKNVEELGYTALHAEDAAAALRILDQHPEVTLLFTDIVMADMNGRALAEEAQRQRPGLKVLFTTGFTRNAVIHNGVVDASVNFLTKPFTLDALAAKIRRVLEADPVKSDPSTARGSQT
jgi:DNA-binding NtrC family response regulator